MKPPRPRAQSVFGPFPGGPGHTFRGLKALPQAPRVGESYFASCKRDEEGHCLPGGGGDKKGPPPTKKAGWAAHVTGSNLEVAGGEVMKAAGLMEKKYGVPEEVHAFLMNYVWGTPGASGEAGEGGGELDWRVPDDTTLRAMGAWVPPTSVTLYRAVRVDAKGKMTDPSGQEVKSWSRSPRPAQDLVDANAELGVGYKLLKKVFYPDEILIDTTLLPKGYQDEGLDNDQEEVIVAYGPLLKRMKQLRGRVEAAPSPGAKSLPNPPQVGESFFSTCKRDEEGHCLPGPASPPQPSAPPRGSERLTTPIHKAEQAVLRAAQRIGHTALSTQEALKQAASRVGQAAWEQLPPQAQQAAAHTWKLAKVLEHLAMKGMAKGQQLAQEAAKERGLSEEQVAQLGKVLALTDVALAWSVNFPLVTAATGSPWAGKASSWLPVASLGYVAYSLGRNPFKTLKAAGRVISGRVQEGHKSFEVVADLAGVLAERFQKYPDPNWWLALFACALDETQDLEESVRLADEASEEEVGGVGEKALDPPRVKESYFATCERDDRGHCLPEGRGGEDKPHPKEKLIDDVMKEAANPASRGYAEEVAERFGYLVNDPSVSPSRLQAKLAEVNQKLEENGNPYQLVPDETAGGAVEPRKKARGKKKEKAPAPPPRETPRKTEGGKPPPPPQGGEKKGKGVARERLDRAPKVPHPLVNDNIQSPFPLVEFEQSRVDDLMDSARNTKSPEEWGETVGEVPMEEIRTAQDFVSRGAVRDKIDNPDAARDLPPPADLPVVYKQGKRYILLDGNHRAVAENFAGQGRLRCYVLDPARTFGTTLAVPPENKALDAYLLKSGFTGKKKDKLGREVCYRDGKRVPCTQPQAPQVQPLPSQETSSQVVGRPTKPEERCTHCEPMTSLPWRAPPPPKGIKGGGKPERGVGERSQTALGDKVEALTEKIGLRNVLPEGRRAHKPGEVESKGSTIDREWDSSGILVEVKMCRTSATEYKCKAKRAELEAKRLFAKLNKAKGVVTMIPVLDEETRELHLYWKEGLGNYNLNPAAGEQNGWHYAGTVSY